MKEILTQNSIQVNCTPEPPEAAIRRSGQLLVDAGCVTPRYIEGMLARDASFSTAIGNFIAIPHGEKAYKADILRTGLSVTTYPDGLDWHGQRVHLVIGIAACGDQHMDILERIVDALDEGEDVLRLVHSADASGILQLLKGE